jgi:hypothetical protein
MEAAHGLSTSFGLTTALCVISAAFHLFAILCLQHARLTDC